WAVLQSLLTAAVLSTFGFVGFKHGFVRHDLHSLIAWGTLALAAAAYAGLEAKRAIRLLAMALSVTAAGAQFVLLYAYAGVSPSTALERRIAQTGSSLTSLMRLVLDEASWLEGQRIAMESGRAIVRA